MERPSHVYTTSGQESNSWAAGAVAVGPVRWGIIGCGDVTEVKSGPAFSRARGSSLNAVMRRTPGMAEDYARRHDVPRWFVDSEELIQDTDIDVIYVATPPDSHRDYVLRCAQASKAVYVEKPMAANHRECIEMIEACEAAGVPLWVGYYRRELPRFRVLERLLRLGVIGEIRAVHTQHSQTLESLREAAGWRIDPNVASGGLFFETACHTLDLLDMLFGPVVEVAGIAQDGSGELGVPDTVSATYRFGSGVVGTGLWCYSTGVDADQTTVYGSAGSLSFATTRPEPIDVYRRGVRRSLSVADPPHVHQPLVQTIVDQINGGPDARSTGLSASRTGWVTDQILKVETQLRWR